jgi:phosphoglycerate dehydrogenase-like enzyme
MDRKAPEVTVLGHFIPGERVLEQLAPEAGWLDVRFCAAEDDETFYALLPDAEVIWRVLRPLSGEDLRLAPRLRLVQQLGTGVDAIDIECATRLGIAVSNMPGANAPSVAEGAVLLMIAALRRLPELDRATRSLTGWPPDLSLGESVRNIGDCTVGLVGYGNIAKRVEAVLLAMGAHVLHTSSCDDGHPAWRSLPELLAVSDIVSLHLPLTDGTHHLLDRTALTSMKPGAVIVNTSRGRPRRLRRRADPLRPSAAHARQRRAPTSRQMVHRGHPAQLPRRGDRQLPAYTRRGAAGERGQRCRFGPDLNLTRRDAAALIPMRSVSKFPPCSMGPRLSVG